MESVRNPKTYLASLGESLCEETRCGQNLPILGIELGEASATQGRDLRRSALLGGHRDPLCLDEGLGIALHRWADWRRLLERRGKALGICPYLAFEVPLGRVPPLKKKKEVSARPSMAKKTLLEGRRRSYLDIHG